MLYNKFEAYRKALNQAPSFFFIIYINDLPVSSNELEFTLFADDTSILFNIVTCMYLAPILTTSSTIKSQ